jgi:predicted enzyme related to lactoylglutathione lyase
MEMKLELVPIPVSDISRAKQFYAEQLGFNVDHDIEPSEGMRIIQLTPPGSACSILIGKGMPATDNMAPGILRGLHLVVPDIETVRAELAAKGVEMSEIVDMGGVFYSEFNDPDGNNWTLQEIRLRARSDDS